MHYLIIGGSQASRQCLVITYKQYINKSKFDLLTED